MSFSYVQTKCYIKYIYSNSKWSDGELCNNPFINLHISSSCLHYGQQCFEGLKAFRLKNGKIGIFRHYDSLARLNRSARYICMPEISANMFDDALNRVIGANIDYIPSYESGNSFYIRPLLIGITPTLGVSPSSDYMFIIFVNPVSSYYNCDSKYIDAIVLDQYDRSTVSGSGSYKLGGNYSITLSCSELAKKRGFHTVLFLDPKNHIYIDEFTASNFISITKNQEYITPKSNTILKSITNDSLMKIAAESFKIPVITRDIYLSEFDNFNEIGACGTAANIGIIRKIVYNDKIIYQKNSDSIMLNKLFDDLYNIQRGISDDKYGWVKILS